MRRLFQTLWTVLGAAVLLGGPAALGYLQFVGFSAPWRERVAVALSGPVYAVEIGRLTFHPFEGIVAEAVNVRRRGDAPRLLAGINRLVVSPNLAALLRGRVSIDRLALEDTSAEIPFAQDGVKPDAISLRGIRAEILSGSGQVTIRHAECWVEDIHLTVRGHLLQPEAVSAGGPTPPEKVEARAEAIRAVLETLRRVRFADPKPELDVTISGDLSRPETLAADAVTLRTGGVRYEELSFDRVRLEASYAGRTVTIARLLAAGPSGTLLAGGTWNLDQQTGHLDLSGGLSLAPLLRLGGRADLAKDIGFDEPPAIEASVTAAPGADGRVVIAATGQVSAGGFRLKGIRARRLATRFAWRDGRIYLQDAVLESRTGTVRAQVLAGPGEFRLALDSDADPTEFREIFGPKEQVIIRLLEFKDAPKVTLSLRGTRPSLDALTGTGRIELGRSAMRGSWIDSGEADVVIADRAILYRDLTIQKGDRRATGSFTYDFGRQEVRLDGIRSSLNPPDVLMWVDPRIAKTVAVYRFRGAPDVRADGVAHMKEPAKNDLRIAVNAPDGLRYALLNRDLPFDNVQGTVTLKGQRLRADVTRGALYGGRVALEADVSIARDDPTFGVSADVTGVDFPSITKLYFGYAKSEGAMSGKYAFTANLRDPSAMRGRGRIRIEEGHVLSIPLFGPLSVVISTILPGAGHERARLATADFTIAQRRIATRNLDIHGAGFELLGEGSVGFPGGDMDLTVRINARGIPGLVFFPVSKLLEYVSTGTVSDPQWRPKIIPREFWEVLGLGAREDEEEASAPPARTPAAATNRPVNRGKSR